MNKATNDQRARTFETKFDGDEYDGKRYGLEEVVTGLDGPTADFLIRQGRIEEIGEDRAKYLAKLKAEKEGADASTETDDSNGDDGNGSDDFTANAQADFDAGRIPDDLIDASKPETDTDRLIGKTALSALATSEGAAFKPNDSKAAIAVAIMAARSKAEANNA